jgi:hypothetical protein
MKFTAGHLVFLVIALSLIATVTFNKRDSRIQQNRIQVRILQICAKDKAPVSCAQGLASAMTKAR